MSTRRKIRKAYRPKPVGNPMIVVQATTGDVEIQFLADVMAFERGWAETPHFDRLADMRDLLTLAASKKNDADTLKVCELAYVALRNIQDHFRETSTMVASKEEVQALKVLAETSHDFWNRQSGPFYDSMGYALYRARQQQKREPEIAP